MLLDDFIFHLDIDECEEGTDGCDYNCTNTLGNYYCTCMDGYELESDNQTCTGSNLLNIHYKCVHMYEHTYIHNCLLGSNIVTVSTHMCMHQSHAKNFLISQILVII